LKKITVVNNSTFLFFLVESLSCRHDLQPEKKKTRIMPRLSRQFVLIDSAAIAKALTT